MVRLTTQTCRHEQIITPILRELYLLTAVRRLVDFNKDGHLYVPFALPYLLVFDHRYPIYGYIYICVFDVNRRLLAAAHVVSEQKQRWVIKP